MKRPKTIVALLLIAFPLLSQTTSPDVLISSGSVFENNAGSISWTIGEILIETVTGDDLNLLQGYHEIEDMPLAVKEIDWGDEQVLVYPTLTESIVNVQFIADYELTSKGYLVDISGQLCGSYDFIDELNQIDLSRLRYGLYILTIMNEKDGNIKETLIIKH